MSSPEIYILNHVVIHKTFRALTEAFQSWNVVVLFKKMQSQLKLRSRPRL